MNENLQLQLQAYLDGELPPGEAQTVRDLLATDAAARDLLTELTQTNAALANYEAAIKLPETREFYWSKIQREINRSPAPARADGFSLGTWLRRVLVPTGALAAVAIALLLSVPRPSGAEDYFSASGDAVAFTYQNYNTGTTLVWLDFAPENDFSDSTSVDTLN